MTGIPKGLYGKYIILKTDGSPVDPSADYFVLRLDTDPAARAAAYLYAQETQEQFPELSAELMEKLNGYMSEEEGFYNDHLSDTRRSDRS